VTSSLWNDNPLALIADATGAAGIGYSTVNATSLDIPSLGVGAFTINLESLTGTMPGAAADFDPAQSYQFVLVNAADGITGTFDPSEFIVMTAPNNGATGFTNPFTGTFSVSESGNNLLLDYTTVATPEPSTYAVMGLGLLGLFSFSRWRKRNSA
jgi:hypothetical protein